MDVSTKIICSIGPACDSMERILALIDAGMNVARINFSHGDYSQHKKIIDNLKKARERERKPLAIMLDTKGPEIRVFKVSGDRVAVKKGDRFKIVEKFSKEGDIQIDPFIATESLKKGMSLLFNDGYIASRVIDSDKDIAIEILNDGEIKSGNGVNIPDCSLPLPALTEKDREDIRFGCQNGCDIIAASFIRSVEHILEIRKLLFEEKSDMMLIAKIESSEGIKNFESILRSADGIMVARGDLGVEIDLSLIPKLQKMMIKRSNFYNKPVIIATQMLESMIKYPRPTRAEVSDIANAIYDSASSLMLSGETAIGRYPIESTKHMRDVIEKTEADFDNLRFFKERTDKDNFDVSQSLAIAAVETAYSSKARCFFVYTSSGFTAKILSSFRPKVPIIALTTKRKTYNQLSLIWGVVPVYTESCKDASEAFDIMSKVCLEKGIISFGDFVVVTAGVPFGRKGSTNMMILDSVGHILVRGVSGNEGEARGEIVIVGSEDVKREALNGKIVVFSSFLEENVSLIRNAKAMILQNEIGDISSKKIATDACLQLKIPLLVDANNATTLLSDGDRVVVDAESGLVYLQDGKG